MIDYLTNCSDSTWSDTRIIAFLIYTSFCGSTICAHYTFWSTSRWNTNETRNASAHSLLVHFSTLTIRSARWWVTWIRHKRIWLIEKKNRLILVDFFMILIFLWLLYLWMDYRKQMHCLSFQQDNYTLVRDCTRCKLHFGHKYRYKDQHICYVDKFESKDNLY